MTNDAMTNVQLANRRNLPTTRSIYIISVPLLNLVITLKMAEEENKAMVILAFCTALLTQLTMTAESMLSKYPVL